MSAASTTLRGRLAAEREMVDHCVVTDVTGKTYDPATRKNVPTTDTVYEGKCRVQSQARVPQGREAGERLVTVKLHEVSVPIAETGFKVGQVVVIDAVNPLTGDPQLVGRRLIVRDVLAKTYATARRLTCEEQS